MSGDERLAVINAAILRPKVNPARSGKYERDCDHYYSNTGDGWMTCVKCGKS